MASASQVNDNDDDKYGKDSVLRKHIPFYDIFDLDRNHAFVFLGIWRLVFTLSFTKMLVHPDELYQGTQIAYDFIYGGVDLPWEWRDPYRIRNSLYPIYLSWPLALLKYLHLDFPYMVLISPYIAHFPLMLMSDYYLWHVGKLIVGKPATRIAFILFLTNTYMVEFEIRCFTNTLEKIFTVTVYHFWMR